MKKLILLLAILPLLGLTSTSSIHNSMQAECAFEDVPLYGKVKFVEYSGQADFSVRFVNAYPDVKVQFVQSFPDNCGEWQVVEFGEDFRVYVDEHYADLKIQLVNNYPGIR